MDSADITSTALIVATTTTTTTTTTTPNIIVNGTDHTNTNGIDTSVSPTSTSTSTSTSPKDTSTSTPHTLTIPNGHPPPFPRSKSESISTPSPTSSSTTTSTTPTLPTSLSHSSSLSSLSSHQQSSLHVDTQNGIISPIPEDLGAIDVEHIIRVIRVFAHEFIPGSNTGRTLTYLRSAQSRVNHLMSLDYHLQLISNANGEYCTTYPLDLVILENEKNGEYAAEASVHNKVNDASVLKPLMRISRFSRVHGRFVIPVILFRNKNICRSSTLSIQAEAIFNNVHAKTREFMASLYDSMSSRFTSTPSSPPKSASFALGMESQRCADEQLLTHLSTKYICDLMVEQKKKRMGVTLTSSEKVETSRYGKFAISSIPYPGCEFFAVYKENQHIAQGLMFDWDQSYCNATLAIEHPYDWKLLKEKRHQHGHTHITSTSTSTCSTTCDHCLYSHHLYHDAHLDWNDYKSWDLVEMTQHYLRLMIGQLTDETDPSGLLVHCVSGWDRTPLFISLLRLSLWADGEIHRSLDATQILYLTITYDWMLFSHNLPCRLEKGEDVFYFCFDFLQYITGEKYSVKYASYIRRIQAEREKATQSPPSIPLTVPTPTPSTSSSISSISSASLLSSTSPPIPTSFPGEIGFTHSSRGTAIISPHLAALSHKTPSLPTLSSSPPSPKHDDDLMLQSQMAGFFNDLSDVIPTPHIPVVDTKEDGDLSLDDLYFNGDESSQHIIPVNETPRDDIEESTSTSTSTSHPIPIPTRQRSVSYDESLGTSPLSDKAPRKMSRCGSWQLIADALSTSPPLISIDPPPSIPPIVPTTTTTTTTTTNSTVAPSSSSSTSTAVLAWTSAQSTSSIAASDIRLSSSLSLSQLNAMMYPTLPSVMALHATSTLLDKPPDIPPTPPKPSQREQRLMAVRSLFQSIYPHALNRDAMNMASPTSTSTSHSQPSSPSIPTLDRPRSQSQSSSHLTRSRLETTAPPTLATHVTSSPLVSTDATAAAETVKQALTTELQPISIPAAAAAAAAAAAISPTTSHVNMALPVVTLTTDKSTPVGLLGWIPRLVGGE